jgi:hypothetical protein
MSVNFARFAPTDERGLIGGVAVSKKVRRLTGHAGTTSLLVERRLFSVAVHLSKLKLALIFSNALMCNLIECTFKAAGPSFRAYLLCAATK